MTICWSKNEVWLCCSNNPQILVTQSSKNKRLFLSVSGCSVELHSQLRGSGAEEHFTSKVFPTFRTGEETAANLALTSSLPCSLAKVYHVAMPETKGEEKGSLSKYLRRKNQKYSVRSIHDYHNMIIVINNIIFSPFLLFKHFLKHFNEDISSKSLETGCLPKRNWEARNSIPEGHRH